MNNDFNQSNNIKSSGKYKNIRIRETSQDWESVDPQVLPEIAKDPAAYFRTKTKRELKLINGICRYYFRTGNAFMRQDTLAKYAGYKCRQTASRLIGGLIADGVLASNYRHKRSCQYKLSSFFNDPQVRCLLRSMMSAFMLFPIQLLIGIPGNVTQEVSSYLFINIESNQLNQREYKHVRERVYTRDDSNEAKENREKVMIKPCVEEIKDIYLTQRDKEQLSKYSDAAIANALKVIREKKDLDNPVAYMIVCCKSFKENAKPRTRSNFESKKESMPRVETVYRVDSKEERDFSRKKKLIYMATVRGESESYLQSLQNNNSPIVDIENAEWERVKFLRNAEAKAAGKPLPFVLGTVAPEFTQSGTKRHELNQDEPVTKSHMLEYTTPTDAGQTSFKESGQRSIRDVLQEHFKGAF